MRTTLLVVSLCISLFVPGIALGGRSKDKSTDNRFEELATKYLAELLAMNPEMATQLGEHRYDARLGDYSLAGVERQRAFNRRYMKALGAIPVNRLSKE